MAAQIDVEVSDQLGFLQDFAPRGTYLETEETFTVVANFLVNMSAEVNSVPTTRRSRSRALLMRQSTFDRPDPPRSRCPAPTPPERAGAPTLVQLQIRQDERLKL